MSYGRFRKPPFFFSFFSLSLSLVLKFTKELYCLLKFYVQLLPTVDDIKIKFTICFPYSDLI